MNLRKLLCGLLALCLLLTMAPAALMEAVEPAVEEIGETLGAEDLTEIVHDDADPVRPVKNTDVTMHVGDTRTLSYEYDVVSCSADTVTNSVVNIKKTGNKSIRLTALDAGDTIVTVKLETNTGMSVSAIVNVTVKGFETPATINVYYDSGYNITGETLKPDVSGSSFVVNSRVFAADKTQLVYGRDYEKVIWSSSKSSVADVSQIKDAAGNIIDPERVRINLKKAGKAVITATVKGTAIKCKFTVNIADAHKPKKVEIKVFNDLGLYRTLTDKQHIFPIDKGPIKLWAAVDPADYAYEVTWSVSDTKRAYFLDSKGNHVKSIKATNGNVAAYLPLYINKTGTTGVITITAKLYNGKKDTLKVKLINVNGLNKTWITLGDTVISGKKIDGELSYLDIEWPDYNDGNIISDQGDEFVIKGHAMDYEGDEIGVGKATYKWSSDNKKVATVAKRNVDGSEAIVKMKKTGKAVITLTVKSTTGITKKTSFTLNVKDSSAPKAIFFTNEDNIAITSLTMKKGQQAAVNVVAEYVTADNPNSMISYSQLKFSTSDKYVAKVSKSGVITAVKKGTAYIKVKTYNGLTKKLKVVVK